MNRESRCYKIGFSWLLIGSPSRSCGARIATGKIIRLGNIKKSPREIQPTGSHRIHPAPYIGSLSTRWRGEISQSIIYNVCTIAYLRRKTRPRGPANMLTSTPTSRNLFLVLLERGPESMALPSTKRGVCCKLHRLHQIGNIRETTGT